MVILSFPMDSYDIFSHIWLNISYKSMGTDNIIQVCFTATRAMVWLPVKQPWSIWVNMGHSQTKTKRKWGACYLKYTIHLLQCTTPWGTYYIGVSTVRLQCYYADNTDHAHYMAGQSPYHNSYWQSLNPNILTPGKSYSRNTTIELIFRIKWIRIIGEGVSEWYSQGPR